MITTRNSMSRFRRGFTLIELMVSAALAITIMWILAEAFKIGIDFTRSARSTGDMMTQLNNAGQILSRDLQANHFYVAHSSSTVGNLGKLSAQRLDLLGTSPAAASTIGVTVGTPTTSYDPTGKVAVAGGYIPPQGYFHIYAPPPTNSLVDGTGDFNINTINAPNPANPTSLGPVLKFTVYLPQGLQQNLFTATTTAPAPKNTITYTSQAAEVAYFLGPPTSGLTSTPPVTSPTLSGLTGSQPLFNLYRRQRLVAPTSDYAPTLDPIKSNDPNIGDILSLSTPFGSPTPVINTLASFGTPYNNNTNQWSMASRVPATPLASVNPVSRVGDDILLSNVLSFEVVACWMPPPANPTNPALSVVLTQPPQFPSAIVGNGSPQPLSFLTTTGAPQNSNHPFGNLPGFTLNPAKSKPYTFDTWSNIQQPYPVLPNANPLAQNLNWNNFYTLNNPGVIPNGAGTMASVPNPNLIPMPIRITALQITIRVYDPKTNQARQNSWRVSM
jgi:prepilin-type N-terminal cleavage/methylation domain-containing protein